MSEQNTLRWEQDADGIVVLTMDDPSQSANTMNAAYVKSMRAAVDRLVKEKDSITGVVIASAKKTFFAGGDLNDLRNVKKSEAKQVFDLGQEIKAQLRTLETLGKPVVAAINGAALGGGLEIALACHHRILADVKGAVVGLPEATLGLLPGGGGVVRTVRMLGITDALMKVLLQGQKYRPQEAKELGLVNEVVPSVDALLPAAKAWVKANPKSQQPWDQKGYKIPGGTPSHPAFAANLPAFPANLRKQLKGANMPAPRAIMAVAVESTQVDVDTAFTIESRYFTELVVGQVAKNMIQAFFFDMQHINSGGGRPKGFPQHTAKKVGVLGAGMMGAGIAYVCAKAGIDVVLKDVSLAAAEKGKGYSVKLVEKAVSKGSVTKEKGDALLARITPAEDPAALAGCDLVIEAVFEDVKLKHKVFQEVQGVVAPDAVLGSNTSTLPISLLAEGVTRPPDFVGMHFFSPVDKMPLLELIAGKQTSDATLAKAIDIAVQIGKTPIVVNDSRGFFTSRVIGTFLNEAIAMVGEGIAPASIEQAGLQAGYPAAPLQLVDELTLTLPRKIRQETKAAVVAAGQPWVDHGSYAVMDALIDQHGRKGRSTGGGFYDYADGKRTNLWPGLAQHYAKPGHTIPFEDMKERMLFAEAIDTVRCFDEGVLRSAADANVGSILGIGFPPWTGGVVQYINGYEGPSGTGPRGFVIRARELAERYGKHFLPPASLVAKAERGELLE
ncbi:enoyl-CoA hydratase/isomerase family protein [Corallococcus exiguus]|uniref:3-hydroxyacyl-CoA dehydrogenase NAD-binding domain-containing protein n=1 Tax=Corallococcus exiguus TaxID=83462 RepID=UPI001A8EF2C5|nr:3-hydroxyacyl-CoA dehydrogenase NAD-binding domain-containing protein [Corallococcus exiguus]MBN8468570.1 enoyl-CoA hydratase/isomerase family protein [Corallococcus exiguus]